MDFITSTISRALGPQQPTLLFTVGHLVEEKLHGSIWTLYAGVKKDDQQPVSVFIFDVKNNPPEKIALAKNALKRAKTLRYPDCVKFIDGAETESQIIIGTEQVESLRSNLFNNLDLNLARLGLLKVASTIKFLSDDCQMIHGNIGVDSVFVTRSGEWKVGGFEVLYSIKDERSFLKTHQYLLPPDRITAPELDMERFVPTTAVDAWSFGCLIFHIFNGVNTLTRSALDNRGQIPMPLFRHYKSLIHQDPRARLSLEKFLAYTSGPGSYFDDDFIGTSLFLEQLALKDKAEKEQFLVNIEKSVATLPINFCKFKILPELIQSLEFGGAGSKALKPILTIGGRLGTKEFEQLVTPAIIKLFNSSDRSIRLVLCEKIESYVNQLSDQACNDTIYPNLATGFADATPIIREQTLKAVSVIAPKLQKKTINNSLLRCLAKLQVDQEPGIRTNTTICLAKLSKYFDESLKSKVLLQAFLRSLLDPFPFARKAGLMGITATSESFSVDDIAKKLLPHVSPLLLDPDRTTRDQAFSTFDALLKVVRKHSSTMGSPVESQPHLNEKDVSNGNSGKEADGWASWAISAVSNSARNSINIAPTNNVISATISPSESSKENDKAHRFSADSHSFSLKQGVDIKNENLVSSKMAPFASNPTAELHDGWGVDIMEDDNGWGNNDAWEDAPPIAAAAKSEKEIERERRQKQREERRRLK